MPLDELMINGEEKMEKAIASVKREFANVRTGRANPAILDKIQVDYYGTPTPIRQMSNVTVQDGTTLVISPYDKTGLAEMERAIMKSDLGITPSNDGNVIRIMFPQLTEDRRKEIVKDVKKITEEGKIALRNARRDMTDALKKIEKEESISEDEIKKQQDEIQKLTDKYVKDVESLCQEKEKEVLTV